MLTFSLTPQLTSTLTQNRETVWFYEELKEKGVDAELVEWKGMPHFFWIIPILSKSKEFMEVWNAKLRGLIEGAAGRKK